MPTLDGLKESPSGWETSLPKPLDEAVWQAWVAKGRAQDRRSDAILLKAAKWVPVAGLLGAAGLWSYLTPYDVAIRLTVAAGAIAVMLQAFHAQRYTLSALFGALALLYNPVAPVFGFSGDWQRVFLVASAIPFLASLAWRNEGLASQK